MTALTQISSRLELRALRRAKVKDAANATKRSYGSVRERVAFARTPRLALLSASLAALMALAAAPSAQAETAKPQWTLTAVSRPTNFKPGDQTGQDSYLLTLTNTGGSPAGCTSPVFESESNAFRSGQRKIAPQCPEHPPLSNPIEVTDELPAGLTLDPAGASADNRLAPSEGLGRSETAGFTCSLNACTYSGAVAPDQTLDFSFPVDVSTGPLQSTCEVPSGAVACLTNTVRVSGGGADSSSISTPTVISESPAAFGIAPGGDTTALSSTQAGSHPDITNTIAFNTDSAKGTTPADAKDVTYRLPPGFASDFSATPECSAAQFLIDECPIETQVGVTTLSLLLNGNHGTYIDPVYNLAPNSGEVAKLGFWAANAVPVQGGISLRPGDYGADVDFRDINAGLAEFDGVSLTVWGVPAASSHDPLRAYGSEHGEHYVYFGTRDPAFPTPYFTNPTSCGSGRLRSSFQVDSWQQPATYVEEQMPFGPIFGCDALTIEPTLEVQPSADSAETATGLNATLEITPHYDNPNGLVASHLDDTKVTLPAGISLNPSAGSGLGSCTEAQFEYEAGTFEPQPGLGCPNESKVGTVRIHSPVLAEEATGSLFVAKPGENPFHSLLALYLVARIPNRGVVVTAAGEVHAEPQTGQLTTTFTESPQLPFDHFTLSFHQGATSPLITPPTCGNFTTDADLTPWSVPTQEHLLTGEFQITSGVNGGPCPSGGTPPFHPELLAGTTNNRAGAYSPLLRPPRPPRRRTGDHPLLDQTSPRHRRQARRRPLLPALRHRPGRSPRPRRRRRRRGSRPLLPQGIRSRPHDRRSRRRLGPRPGAGQDLPRRPLPRRPDLDRRDHRRQGWPL